MGAFEWSILILLALILLRTGAKESRAEKPLLDSLVQIEALLGSINTHLAEIDASTSAASHNISDIRLAQLPDFPPDGP